MKKLFLLILFFCIPLRCFGVHLYEPYIAYPNNSNLIFITDTYDWNLANIQIGCFLYKNVENKKIGDTEFQYERYCLMYDNVTDNLTCFNEHLSRFIFYNNLFTYGEPYYYDKPEVQKDIKRMFDGLRYGTWTK